MSVSLNRYAYSACKHRPTSLVPIFTMRPVKASDRILLRHPRLADGDEFIRKVKQSRSLHRPWVYPPQTAEQFSAYVARSQTAAFLGLLVTRSDSAETVGVVNLSEIVRGAFQSAYLGFYAFVPNDRKGYLYEALQWVLRHSFAELRLHRLEANVQPGNIKSKRLIEKCGFRQEGYSPGYLKIGGRWRDHERWAMLRETWRAAGCKNQA